MNEKYLRQLIRNILLESERYSSDKDDDVLGEPDLSMEKERENPEFKPPDEDTIDEMNVVGAAGAPAGNIVGFTGPLDNPPITTPGPSDHLGGKKKNKRKKRKKSN